MSWIKAKDKKPESNRAVLIYTQYGGQTTAYLSPKCANLWIDWMRPQHNYGGVSHWRELPEPPEKIITVAMDTEPCKYFSRHVFFGKRGDNFCKGCGRPL